MTHVDNIAVFTAHAPFCCCSRVVSEFSRVKVRQAPTSYLLVHLTNSTTLTAHIWWYSNRCFRNFLHFTSSEDPLLSYPTHCRPAAVSRIPGLDQPPNCANSLRPLLEQRRRIFKIPCTAYGIRELHDYRCLPPYIPAGGGVFRARGKYECYFRREMQLVYIIAAIP